MCDKNTRRAHRGQMTKLVRRAEAIYLGKDPPSEGDRDTLAAILENMASKLEFLQRLDQKIASDLEDFELEKEIIDADDYTLEINE